MNKETKKLYKPSSNGRFGKFGGKFVPEALMSSLKEIENAFDEISKDQSFWDELILLQKDFVGRPTPIYFAKNLSQPIEVLMTNKNLVTVSENISMRDAQKLLHKHRIEKLLVVDKNISVWD